MNNKDDKKANEFDRELTELRNYKIVKSNDMIQKSRFNLQTQEQRIILYLISKIQPEDMELKEHSFNIRDFCKVCGLDADNGFNYKQIKKTLKDLRDKSIWITLDDGSEALLSWLDSVIMHPKNGTIKVKISEMIKPYLLHLREKFTQYELLYTLAMKSQYSLRLYELLKSYEFQSKKIFDINELKRLLSAENYVRYPDFKRYVLDIAMREINDLSDLSITYEAIKSGKRYAKIEFTMRLKKDVDERLETWAKIDEVISPKQEPLRDKVKKTTPPPKEPITTPKPPEVQTDIIITEQPTTEKPPKKQGFFSKLFFRN